MSGYRPAYGLEEQRTILNFIVENNKYYELRGTSCWKELAESGTINRTWQSLKEHFLKTIYPKLHYKSFELTGEQIELIKLGFEETSKSSLKATKPITNRSVSSSVQKKGVDLSDMFDSSDDD